MWAQVVLFFSLFYNASMYDVGVEYKPDPSKYYLTASSGSFRGWTSIGLGININSIWSSELTLGYTPHFHGGPIVQGSSKNILGYRFNKVKPYGYIESILTNHGDTFIKLPEHYPDGYYPATAYHTVFGAGLEYYLTKDVSTYIEVSTLDIYLEAYYRNPGHFELYEVGTYGVGFKKNLE